MAYTFDVAAQRYRLPNGRFLNVGAALRSLEKDLARLTERTDQLADDYRAGRISLDDWRFQMMDTIKHVQMGSATLAKGGRQRMGPEDNGRVGQLIREQYGFLEQWVRDIQSGEAPIDGRLTSRARLYVAAGRPTYVAVQRVEAEADGFTEERSVAKEGEHCDLCLAEEAKDWQPIGTLVPIGERTCLVNCKCTMEYRKGAVAVPKPRSSGKGTSPASTTPSEPAPASEFGNLLTFEGDTSPEFQAEVRQAVASLPAGVREMLAAKGITIRAGRTITEILPELRGAEPRGYGKGWTWDTAEGLYHPQKKLIVVSEYARPEPSKPLERSTRIPGGIGHEAGHAIDDALKDQKGEGASNQAEFFDAYSQDTENEDQWSAEDRQLLEYFLQPFGAGRSEAWAEGFAIHADLPATERETVAAFRRRFPRVLRTIQRRVR